MTEGWGPLITLFLAMSVGLSWGILMVLAGISKELATIRQTLEAIEMNQD